MEYSDNDRVYVTGTDYFDPQPDGDDPETDTEDDEYWDGYDNEVPC